MQTFKNRLKYYLVGLSMGLVFTFFIFGNRGCEWLPDNRVKNMIAEKEIIVGDSILDIMNCQGVTNNHIYALLEDAGDVDYGKSDTHSDPKEYQINGSYEGNELHVRYALGDSLVEVIEVQMGTKNCTSIVSNRNKQTLPLPQKDVIAILESHEFRIIEKANCQRLAIGMSENELLEFHKTAFIDIEASQPRLQPNPYYVMNGFFGTLEISVKYELGENRTRILEFTNLTECQEGSMGTNPSTDSLQAPQ